MRISEIIKELQKMENQEQEFNLVMVPKDRSPNGVSVAVNEKSE